jgi:hypothetical protein
MNKYILDHTLVQLLFILITHPCNHLVLYFLFGREHSNRMHIAFAYVIQSCVYMNTDRIAVHYFNVYYRVPLAWAEVTSILDIVAGK